MAAPAEGTSASTGPVAAPAPLDATGLPGRPALRAAPDHRVTGRPNTTTTVVIAIALLGGVGGGLVLWVCGNGGPKGLLAFRRTVGAKP